MMPPPPPPPLPPPPPPSDPHTMEANGTERYPVKPESPGFLVFMNTLNTITQLLLGAVVFSACSFAVTFYSGSLSQHIYLCTIGYVVLMSQAILSFNPYAGWSHGLKHETRKVIHIVMQIGGSILAIAGSIVRITDSSRIEDNFQTTHGILGLVAMILTFLSLIGGVLNFVFASKAERGKIFKVVHACLGATTITIAFICLCFGFNHNLFRFISNDTESNLSIALTVGALIGILSSVCMKIFRRMNYS